MSAAIATAAAAPRADAHRYRTDVPQVTDAARAAVEAAYGTKSAQSLAAEHGLTKGIVTGIWHRAKAAGRIRAMTERELADRKRPKSTRAAAPAGKPEAPARKAKSAPAPTPEDEVSTEAAPVSSPPSIDPAPAPRAGLVLTGVAAAYAEADACGPTCRWPVGDPRADDFRFCGAPVRFRTVGERGRERPNFYCEGCREAEAERVGKTRRAAPFHPAQLGHAIGAGSRAVTAGPTRHGRAG